MDDKTASDFWRQYSEEFGDRHWSSSSLRFLQNLRNQLAHAGGSEVTPPLVVDFMAEFLRAHGASEALDPHAKHGLLLALLAKRVPLQKAVGITQHANINVLRDALDSEVRLGLIPGDPFTRLHDLKESFRAIVSELPIGMPLEQRDVSLGDKTVPLRLGRGDHILLASLPRLAQDGVALFVVASTFLRSPSSAAQHLAAAGVHPAAFVELPAGTYAPWTSIPFGLIVLSRRAHETLFVGALSESSERNDILLQNLLQRHAGPEPALGALVDHDQFHSIRGLQLANQVERLARPLGVSAVPLGSIAKAINRVTGNDDFEDVSNSVYLPLIGNSAAVASLPDRKIKPQNYAQVVLDPEKADARFTASFLSTPLGLLLRESAQRGATIPKLNKASIAEMPVYLPPLEAQLRVIEVDTALSTVLSEAQALRERLWTRPRDSGQVAERLARLVRSEQSTDWIDYLPFPLATVAWAWGAAGEDYRRRCETLLHFFEAYAEFTAIVLLSAFANDTELFNAERATIRIQLEKGHASVVKSSFGTWVRIIEQLAKRARILLNGSVDEQQRCCGLFRTQNRAFLEGLLSAPIVGVLQEVNGRRNTWLGHTGAVGDREARERHVVLSSDLAKLREELRGTWSGITLLQPTERSRFTGGVYNYEVSRLMGTRTPFVKEHVETIEPLEDERLYLLASGESRVLKLLPLVRILASPESAQNAAYFYNRRQTGGLRFISYHFEQASEVIREFPDAVEALQLVFPEDFASGLPAD